MAYIDGHRRVRAGEALEATRSLINRQVSGSRGGRPRFAGLESAPRSAKERKR